MNAGALVTAPELFALLLAVSGALAADAFTRH